MGNNENSFSYTYSAKEQEEIRSIREKYKTSPKEDDKMEKLRRLDRSVYKKAQTVSLTLGIIGLLILGFGMSLIMTELQDILGSFKDMAMLLGIVIGVAGGALASVAYPVYELIVKQERKRIAPEIIRLTDELMK